MAADPSTVSRISSPTLRPIQLKLVYWGPGEAGKTTNYNQLRSSFPDQLISKGFSIATTDQRSLWNDAVAFHFPMPQLGLLLIIHVATTTGQERFLMTREYILQNADGIIFVADSSPVKMADNVRSYEEFVAFTKATDVPIFVQLNKRDLPDAVEERTFRVAMKLPLSKKTDAVGFKLIYPAIAISSKDAGVKTVFADMVQKLLQTKVIKFSVGVL